MNNSLRANLVSLSSESSLDHLKSGDVVQRGQDDYIVVDAVYPMIEPYKAEIYFYFETSPGRIVRFSAFRNYLKVKNELLVMEALGARISCELTRENSGFEYTTRRRYLEHLGLEREWAPERVS